MKLRDEVVATWSINGQQLEDAAVALIVKELQAYPLNDVAAALSRCRRELKRMTLADVLDRIPGQHPGVEEAWSIVAKALNDERVTIVLTDQMMQAFGSALDVQEDPIAARMAFKEVYTRLVAIARDQRTPIRWRPSLGHDASGREGAVLEAVEKGRITAAHAAALLPVTENTDARVRELVEKSVKRIESK